MGIYEIKVQKENAILPMSEELQKEFLNQLVHGNIGTFRIIVEDGFTDDKVVDTYYKAEKESHNVPWLNIEIEDVGGDLWMDVKIDDDILKSETLKAFAAAVA